MADVCHAVRARRVRVRRGISQALATRGGKPQRVLRGREVDGHVPQFILLSPVGAKSACVKDFDA